MTRRHKPPYRLSLAGLVGVALVVIGCGSPAASPSTVALQTERQPTQVCQQALLTGELVTDPDTGLAISSSDGHVTKVTWPYGYTAQEVNGTLSLLDASGTVVATVGDQVEMGGGSDGNGVWHACAGTVRRVAG